MKFRHRAACLCLPLVLLGLVVSARADVELPAVFSHSMVLQQQLLVPVGLIGCNWGGTRIEPWTSLDGFRSVAELKEIADQVQARELKSKRGEEVKVGGGTPAAIYNSMVHPLVPFAMRGAIWYQGESNGGEGESYYYKTRALVNGWRNLFNPDLGFYWVQLANFQQPNDNPAGGDGWARIREAERKSLLTAHTGMAVIIDIGEAKDIHPRNKQDVGWRLAQWALHQTYGKKELVPCGPLYQDYKVEKGAIRIRFDHVGGGLIVGEKHGLEPTREAKDGRLVIGGGFRGAGLRVGAPESGCVSEPSRNGIRRNPAVVVARRIGHPRGGGLRPAPEVRQSAGLPYCHARERLVAFFGLRVWRSRVRLGDGDAGHLGVPFSGSKPPLVREPSAGV